MSNDCNLCELKIPSESPEMAVFNVFNNFIEQLVECADENWCPSHVEMIKRLILSVLSGVDYAEVDEHMICDFFEQYCSDEKNLNHAFHENVDMEKLIEFLKKEFPNGIQMFNTRNIVGDTMYDIYSEDGIVVDYCYGYEYIEVFGLSDEEFNRLDAEING